MPIRQFPIRTGGKGSISTTPLQLTTVDAEGQRGIQITADSGNTAAVYVGESNAITPGTVDATDGYPIAAGATLPSSPWAITSFPKTRIHSPKSARTLLKNVWH